MTAMLRYSRTSSALRAALFSIALVACSSGDPGVPDEALGGLVVAPTDGEEAIDMERVRHGADELVRAANLSHARVSEYLGSHRYRARVTIAVKEGETAVETLGITTRIDYAADGSFHAKSENDKEYGREVVYHDGALYLAPRYSRFHKRAPETADEPADIRGEMFAELGAHLELIGRGIEVEDLGTGPNSAATADSPTADSPTADSPTIGPDAEPTADDARTVRTLGIVKAAADRPVQQPERLTQRAWRDSIAVAEVSGKLALDTQTGVVLHAEVHGALTFQRDGRSFTMIFDIAHDISDIGADIAVTAPTDDRWVATPLRRREVEERDRLLEGIAPPTRKFKPEKTQTATSQKRPGSSAGKASGGGT